jgi:hypothetical protein
VRVASHAAPTKQDQWQKLLGYVLGYQATWITDIGLKTRPGVAGMADHPDATAGSGKDGASVYQVGQ